MEPAGFCVTASVCPGPSRSVPSSARACSAGWRSAAPAAPATHGGGELASGDASRAPSGPRFRFAPDRSRKVENPPGSAAAGIPRKRRDWPLAHKHANEFKLFHHAFNPMISRFPGSQPLKTWEIHWNLPAFGSVSRARNVTIEALSYSAVSAWDPQDYAGAGWVSFPKAYSSTSSLHLASPKC